MKVGSTPLTDRGAPVSVPINTGAGALVCLLSTCIRRPRHAKNVLWYLNSRCPELINFDRLSPPGRLLAKRKDILNPSCLLELHKAIFDGSIEGPSTLASKDAGAGAPWLETF